MSDPRERFDSAPQQPAPVPTHVHYHREQRQLELVYHADVLAEHGASDALASATRDDQEHAYFTLPVELLRVFSPSAEVRGHSPDQAVLQTGKRDVTLLNIEPVGNYALKLFFDDGHNSGIYSWAFLFELAIHRHDWWQHYLKELETAGASRAPLGIQIKQL
ncbi:gamma-butyrobetaine hydroxylase-like domain-containing protein [Carnimonas nigrificans]|uniref:gamma-butyrobetaine hydroxylase-like domain-containing protein n=1 Tax=Carnimonas nigrificans TaxID=64323 RepID=UPI000470D35C|nr:gamma-butyrobetaine hydroxylase-like domain-containing protein [Carnimonas nigrificans]